MTTQTLLLAGSMVCLVATAAALLVAWGASRRSQRVSTRQQVLVQELAQLRGRCDRSDATLDNGAHEQLRLARRILALEDTVGELEARLAQAACGSPSGLPDPVLDGAIRRVRGGADAAVLVREYGMSAVEAELLVKLHGTIVAAAN